MKKNFMKIKLENLNIIKKVSGFTLIELVMTILLIGILSIGLYEVVIWGVSDYVTNEQYLHSNNSMTYAMAAIRRSMTGAVMPTASISPSGNYHCKLSNSINPATSGNLPIVTANMPGQTSACGGTGQPVCDEAAFYQNITGTANQQLVVFCVSNNILYEEVTNGTGTTSYPIANNITGISF
jgi:prepilin-type N-terminal cleavage/methylation domain-containing protein